MFLKLLSDVKKISFLIILIFITTRVFTYFVLQIRLSDISYGYHLLDKDLLNNHFFSSLLYLHSQPYLWNFFNGIVVNIFDGHESSIELFFTFYHQLLSLISLFIFYLILKEYKIKLKTSFFVILFFCINPTIIFFENIFSYAHTTFFIFNILILLIIKFINSNMKNSYELGIYFCFFLLGNIWLLFQPHILIPLAFVIIRFFKKSNFKVLLYSLIFTFVSLSPILKNKLVFGEYILASKGGHDFSVIFYDWEDYCGHPVKDIKKFEKIYFEKYQKEISHPSIVGEKSNFNNVGMIPYAQNCKNITFERLVDEPLTYLESRVYAFLAAHGKFGFDYVYPVPNGWNRYYSSVNQFYENKNIKLLRQIIIFIFKMFIYFTILKFILSKKIIKENRFHTFLAALVYIYLLLMAVFIAGTEQERILYTGFIINLFFIICFLKNRLKS